jgi:D-lactate dehydrogenase
MSLKYLEHLIIGSEGTLAFIEEITYYTVEDLKDKASALIYFKDMKEACHAVTKLKLAKEAKTKLMLKQLNLMDRAGLQVLKMTLQCQLLSKILMKM